MRRHASDRRLARVVAWVAAAVCLALPAGREAMGDRPLRPRSILAEGDAMLLSGPTAEFVQEIDRLAGTAEPNSGRGVANARLSGQTRSTLETDVADLAAALKEDRTPEEQARKTLEEYRRVRQAIADFLRKKEAWDEGGDDSGRGEAPRMPSVRVPADLPVGFGKYLEGAIFYHQGKLAEARAAWQAVLDSASPHRAVWAAYMIARSHVRDAPNLAAALFPRVRQLAEKGFNDSQNLSRESLGWEARANLALGRYDRAVDLYLRQRAAGDAMAVWSLRDAADGVLSCDEANLALLAGSEVVRPVVAAFLISSRGGGFAGVFDPGRSTRWLEAVEKAGKARPAEAERLAWAAWQGDDEAAALRWADRAPEGAPVANWVRAKLLLRQEKPEEAARILAAVLPKLPRMLPLAADRRHGWHQREPIRGLTAESAAGELAVLELARSRYAEALDLFLRYGWWEDAAYVAERILALQELRGIVDANWPAPLGPASRPAAGAPASAGDSPAVRIRHILARRLMREANAAEARPYLPERVLPDLQAYERLLAEGRDANRTKEERAYAFAEAGRLLNTKGADLLSAETPQDLCWDMEEYAAGGDFASRLDANLGGVAPASADERRRAAGTFRWPPERWRHQYAGADLMWQAAALMPDGNDHTARVLCEGGTWLKNGDPNAADRFYKALVRRCGNTALGKDADRKRWFPPLPEAPAPPAPPAPPGPSVPAPSPPAAPAAPRRPMGEDF